jgi:hypothetical protein
MYTMTPQQQNKTRKHNEGKTKISIHNYITEDANNTDKTTCEDCIVL